MQRPVKLSGRARLMDCWWLQIFKPVSQTRTYRGRLPFCQGRDCHPVSLPAAILSVKEN